MKKYLKAFCSGVFQQFNDRSQLLGRTILFTVIVYLFYQIFESVGAPQERLWYYAMTEAIIRSIIGHFACLKQWERLFPGFVI